MSAKLKLRVAKTPSPKAAISTKEIRASKRLLRRIFGTKQPGHKMAIILPGSEMTEVDVQFIDSADDDAVLDAAIKRHPAGSKLHRAGGDAA